MSFQTTNGKLFYRIGDVIISTNNQNPSSWYGGTWELFAPGRTIVCIDTSQNEFNTVKKTGGSKELQQHSHSGSVNSGGSHSHSGSMNTAGEHNHIFTYSYKYNQGNTGYDFTRTASGTAMGRNSTFTTEYAGAHTHSLTLNNVGGHTHSLSINNTGSGNAQNLQPFITVYMWIRIA